MKPIKNSIDNQFLKNLVKEQLTEQKKEKEEGSWWSSGVNSFKQMFHSVKRGSNKALYDNNREQAVANIESSDPEIDIIKDFFSLYSEVSYEGSIYASAFKSSWAIEDPGTYSLQDDTKDKLNSWRNSNKKKFIKEMIKAEKNNKSPEEYLEIIEEYVEDFCSTFDYYGLRIEAGANRLTVSESDGMNLVKACIKSNPGLVKDWKAQFFGSKICIIDTFSHLFKFIWELNTGSQSSGPSGIDDLEILEQTEEPEKQKPFPGPSGNKYPNIADVFRTANLVRSSNSLSAGVESQKKTNYVSKLRGDSGFRRKWVGFCYNMTFDPYGEHDLNYWTSDIQALKTKSQRTDHDMWTDLSATMFRDGVLISGGTVAMKKGLNAIKAARAAAAGASIAAQGSVAGASALKTAGVSILIFAVTSGVTALVCFDPFEWFSVRDDIEEEYEEVLNNLVRLNKLASAGNIRSSTKGREELSKIRDNIRNSFTKIIRLLHESMEDGLQREIGNIKTQMDQKKFLLGNLTSSIQTARQQIKVLDFSKQKIDNAEITMLITFCKETINQLKNIGAEESKWDNKMKRDTNLGSDIKSIENIRENLITEQVSPIFSDNDVKNVSNLIKQRYGIDINAVEDYEAAANLLQRARDIAMNYSSQKPSKPKEKYEKSYEFLDDSDPGNLNSQASSFADWWDLNFRQDQPENIAQNTIYNPVWVQSALGLRSNMNYGKTSLVRDDIGVRNTIEAYCVIGLCHGLANTSFYYTHNSGMIIGPNSMSLRQQLLKKSEVDIQSGVPNLIDYGSYIQSIRVLIRDVDVNKAEEELKQVVNKVSKQIKTTEDKTANTLLRVLNLMCKIYYNNDLGAQRLAKTLIVADDKLTAKMKSLSKQLSALPPEKQNTAEHALLLSNLRQAGGWKIMIFQAIMSIG